MQQTIYFAMTTNMGPFVNIIQHIIFEKVFLVSIKIAWNENAVTCDKCKEMSWKC